MKFLLQIWEQKTKKKPAFQIWWEKRKKRPPKFPLLCLFFLSPLTNPTTSLLSLHFFPPNNLHPTLAATTPSSNHRHLLLQNLSPIPPDPWELQASPNLRSCIHKITTETIHSIVEEKKEFRIGLSYWVWFGIEMDPFNKTRIQEKKEFGPNLS